MKDYCCAIERWSPVGENDKIMNINSVVPFIFHLELQCTENKLAHLLNGGFTKQKTNDLVNVYKQEVANL